MLHEHVLLAHVHPVPDIETSVRPEGTVSVTITVPLVGPAPLLGEHSGDVLADWLGVEAGTIAELKAGKVITEPLQGPAKAIA